MDHIQVTPGKNPNEFIHAGKSGSVRVGVTPGGHARVMGCHYGDKADSVVYMNRDQFDSLIDCMIGLRNLLPAKPL